MAIFQRVRVWIHRDKTPQPISSGQKLAAIL